MQLVTVSKPTCIFFYIYHCFYFFILAYYERALYLSSCNIHVTILKQHLKLCEMPTEWLHNIQMIENATMDVWVLNINANRIYDKKDRARLDFIHLWVTFGLYMTGK